MSEPQANLVDQESRITPVTNYVGIERELSNADTPAQIRGVLKAHFDFVTDEHLDFLENEAKKNGISIKQKLRELYYEVIKYDLKFGTKTSHFITEATLRKEAIEHPERFADAEAAKSTVRHRSSQTNSVRRALTICRDFLQSNGLTGAATLHDLGCGSGKIIAMGMDQEGEFGGVFRKAVGIDYYEPMVEISRTNMNSPKLVIDPETVDIKYGSAATYSQDFNGVNVITAYNPFEADIMAQVERNVRRYGGQALFAYIKPMHEHLFTAENNWRVEEKVDHKDPDRRITVLSHGFDN